MFNIYWGYISRLSRCVSGLYHPVSLRVDTDAGAVVGRADEFDAGGFEGVFDGIEVRFCAAWDACARLHALYRADTYGALSGKLFNAPI